MERDLVTAIALFASSRRHGNTGQLMDRIATDLRIEVIDLAQKNISAFDYEHRNRGDDFERLIEHILRFDPIVFASPIYWYSVCPPMKAFIDRLSDLLEISDLREQGRKLRAKTGFVLCTSIYEEPARSFVDLFRDIFGYLGMNFGGYLHANCEHGYTEERYERNIQAFVQRIRGHRTGEQ